MDNVQKCDSYIFPGLSKDLFQALTVWILLCFYKDITAIGWNVSVY
jgi:hypothetical protein